MRINVDGEGFVADELRRLVVMTQPFVLSQDNPAFTLRLRRSNEAHIKLDSQDGELETHFVSALREACRQHVVADTRTVSHLMFETVEGNQDPAVLEVWLPVSISRDAELMVRWAMWVALVKATKHGQLQQVAMAPVDVVSTPSLTPAPTPTPSGFRWPWSSRGDSK